MRKNEKITALYERLSRDDFGKDDDQQRESNSTFPASTSRSEEHTSMKEVEAGNVEYLCIIFAKVITAQSFVQSCDFLIFSHNLRSFLRF